MEAQKAQAAKVDSELFYDAFRASPIGIALETLEGQPLFVNPALCSMLGYSEEEMRSKHCVDFSPPEDAEKDWALFEQLRAGSIDHYELDKRFFRRDGSLIWGRLSISLLNGRTSPLVIAMVEDITEKRAAQEERSRAERAMRESEERFRLLTNTAPVAIWMAGVDKLCTFVNQPFLAFTGQPFEAVLGNGWAESVHPEDAEACWNTYTKAYDRREPLHMEYRLRRHDGEYRWMLGSGVPRFNADGSFAGYIGTAIDVTERKLAEEALSTVSQKLIEAQEEERTRIARELHDDISQRLALLAANLESLKQVLPASERGAKRRIEEANKRVGELGTDIQALSHRLHSPKLEYMGLEPASRSFCEELSERQNVEIDFASQGIPKNLPSEIALCLFRVLQEALHNAVRHSGVRHFKVSLTCREDEIELGVEDLGIGFDPEKAVRGHGLGLTSMRERLKLVAGQLTIHSKPQRGTTIHARVPRPLQGMARAAEA